jgi:hypothetical protein
MESIPDRVALLEWIYFLLEIKLEEKTHEGSELENKGIETIRCLN